MSFCNESQIHEDVNTLQHGVYTAYKYITLTLSLIAVFLIIPAGLWEYYSWIRLQRKAEYVRNQVDPVLSIHYINFPLQTKIVDLLFRKINVRRKAALQWSLSYIASKNAQLLLVIGLVGLLSCLLQFILLTIVRKEMPRLDALIKNEVHLVSQEVNRTTEKWISSVNGEVMNTQTRINDHLFGAIHKSSGIANETLAGFLDSIDESMHSIFGESLFKTAINDTMNCLFFLKLRGIQQGFEWLHNHTQMKLPQFNSSLLQVGCKDDCHIIEKAHSFADKIYSAFMSGIQLEVKIALGVLCVWLLLVAIAVAGYIKQSRLA